MRYVDIKQKLWTFYRTNVEFTTSKAFMPIHISNKVDKFIIEDLPRKLSDLDPRFQCDIVKAGSTSEGVSLFRAYSQDEVIEHEFDILFVVKSLEIDRKDVVCFESSEKAIETFPRVDPCHALICLYNDKMVTWNDCLYQKPNNTSILYSRNGEHEKTQGGILSPKSMVKVFRNSLIRAFEDTDIWRENVCRVEVNGPAITLVMDFKLFGEESTYSFDFVLAVKGKYWSLDAKDWPKRNRQLPNTEIIQDIVDNGVYLVPKSSTAEKEDFEWRVSFSYGERKLMSMLYKQNPGIPQQRHTSFDKIPIDTIAPLIDDKCIVECYRILKYLIKKHISSPKLLTSYHLKTVLLWNWERLPEDFWSRKRLAYCFIGLLDDLIFRFSEGNIPQFFVPSSNLLLKFHKDFSEIVLKKLIYIRRHIDEYLPGPRDFHGFPVNVSYSDTFVEDSERYQLQAMQQWISGDCQENTKPKEPDKKPSFSYSFSFKQKTLDPTRKDNTFMRKGSKNDV